MSGHIERRGWIDIALFGCLAMVLPVQGASFDCAKASTKVEKMICADAGLSLQDEEVAKVYGEVLKKSLDEALLKKQQRGSIKARNQCKDISCLRDHYRGRLAVLNEANVFKNEENYTLLMNKDDELCNHMMELFNQDLEKYGWRGDEHQEEHEEFKRIPWEPARFSFDYYGHTQYRDVEGALFDFNNDGVQDFVVRHIGSLSNVRADSLHIFDAETAKRANGLTSAELWNARNQISLAGDFYTLSSPLIGKVAILWVLEPFIYRDTSYLFMRPVFETKHTTTGYAVITKYGGGKFVNREMTGKMEDVCYYQRNRAKRAH